MEVLLALGGVVLGFVLSFGSMVLHDWWKSRAAKQSLVAVLLVEVMSQAHWCCERGNRWNLLEHSDGQIELKVARQDRPPEAQVYMAVAGQIGQFKAIDASCVIAFHGAVSAVRSLIVAWGVERENYSLHGGQSKDLAQKWRSACVNALLAIRALEPIAKIPPAPNDEIEIPNLKRNLLTVAEGDNFEVGSNRS